VSSPGSAAQTVRDIIETNRYLVLATADAAGRPWSSPIGAGQGVYMSAVAKLVDEAETTRSIQAFSSCSVAHGGHEWTSEDVRPGAGLRLYQATADAHWILAKDGQPDHRVSVDWWA
jgi:hypothetical protein